RRYRSLVDENQTGGMELGLLRLQRLSRGRDVRPILLTRMEDFFERDLVAVVEAPHRAHGDAELLLSTKSFADFLQRQIGLLGNEMEQQFSCALSGDRLWPVQGLSSTLPVVVHRLSQRTAVEAATLSRRATSRRLSPSSTNATARARKSFEYPLAMIFLRRC